MEEILIWNQALQRIHDMTAKLMTLILILFSLAGFAIPGGVLHTTPVFAQNLEADDLAEAVLEEQEVDNEATTTEDSSADDNVLENDNDFGDDDTVVDQDNEADQDAANVGVQEQDTTQDIEQEQDAANLNVDRDVQIGIQQPLPPPPPPEEEPPTQPPTEPPGPPPEERGVFCFSGQIPTRFTFCFATQSECEEFRQSGTFMGSDVVPLTECERVSEIPENCEPIGAGRLPCAEQTGPRRD
jgi:hypothetical protein